MEGHAAPAIDGNEYVGFLAYPSVALTSRGLGSGVWGLGVFAYFLPHFKMPDQPWVSSLCQPTVQFLNKSWQLTPSTHSRQRPSAFPMHSHAFPLSPASGFNRGPRQ